MSLPDSRPVLPCCAPAAHGSRALKRAFDLLASALGLLLLAPLLIALALWIKSDSPGPVFFRQIRVGRGGVLFRIHKFRTMQVGAEGRGQLTVGADARVTGAGRLLRKTKLDELPQLIDVLLGDMSLVGPRPEVPKYVAHYPDEVKALVLSVRPGITDWASIRMIDENEILGGAADPERAYIEEILPEKLEHYVRYVQSHGLWEDLRIIFFTLFRISERVPPRYYSMAALMVLDAILLPLALLSAVLLRLGGNWDPKLSPFLWIFLLPPLWVIPIFIKLGLYRAVLRHLDDQIVYSVFYGVSLSLLVLMAVIVMGGITPFPRTALIIFWVFAMAYIGGSRFLLRGVLRRMDATDTPKQPVIIYGAGHAGIQLMLALQTGREYRAVAFVDDNRHLWWRTFRGVTVHPPAELAELIKEEQVQSVLLAMPSVSRQRQREIILQLEKLHVPIKQLPSMAELVSGDAQMAVLHEVQIEDLFEQSVMPSRPDLLEADIAGQVVLVTGAGGVLGAELCRQIICLQPARVLLFEQCEAALNTITHELSIQVPGVVCTPLLGSVSDAARLSMIMQSFSVHTIYHAAFYNDEEMVERNPIAGIVNNVFGTRVCASVAEACGVQTFVLVSTDKAEQPSNVIGASRYLAELIVQSIQQSAKKMRFMVVRLGNILGDAGSIISLFRQQIAAGGPITLAHEDSSRYFLPKKDAVQLLIQAGAMGVGGDLFVLDMGRPVRLMDVARRMVHLSGQEVKDAMLLHGDIELRITGLRQGEKLCEELLPSNVVQTTAHPRILRYHGADRSITELSSLLSSLSHACDQQDEVKVLALLRSVIHEPHWGAK